MTEYTNSSIFGCNSNVTLHAIDGGSIGPMHIKLLSIHQEFSQKDDRKNDMQRVQES